MTPSIGRIVGYTLTEDDAEKINKRRSDAEKNGFGRMENDGKQVHFGNSAQAGDTYPMLIVRTWPGDLVNGKVELDGTDVLWVTSKAQSDEAEAGRWSPLPRVA